MWGAQLTQRDPTPCGVRPTQGQLRAHRADPKEGIPGEEKGKPSPPPYSSCKHRIQEEKPRNQSHQNILTQSTSSALHQTLIFSPRHLLREHYFI